MSAASWTALPVAADGSWTYAAIKAKRLRAWSAVAAAAFGVTLTIGAIRLWWWNGGAPHQRLGWGVGVWFALAFASAPLAVIGRIDRSEFRQLDAAARRAAVGGST